MTKPIRFGSTVSLVALATIIAGCAFPQSHANRASDTTATGEVGLATRAMAALASNNIPAAIDFAERAVEKTPDDATIRVLLGNTYFAAGRFASAEAAYKDALSLHVGQAQVVLKLALVQIAQGKTAEAGALLDSARYSLDPVDYGLALALSGRASDAIAVLEPAARVQGADARVRQNLALAYAFSGDWSNARAIAAQDVPADKLDGRIQQWMQLATPKRPSDQVAALVGVVPAAADPGQPVRLALNRGDTRAAEASVPAPAQQVTVALPPAEPVAVPTPAPGMAEADQLAPAPAPVPVAQAAAPPDAPAFAAVAPAPPPVRKASVRAPFRNAAFRHSSGKSSAVIQLGAYASPQRVSAAWNIAARRHNVLKSYVPMSARFNSVKGPVYRLSVKGFASDREARLVCESLRRAGGSCFVRNVAGDAPVQFASR
jgi:Flp pilus assembly protein TadD